MERLMLAALLCGAFLATAQQPAARPARQQTVRQRQVNQQKRIGEGVESGRLTPRETVRLENKETKLNREIRRDRRDGDGLNPAERLKINRQQNRLSKDIYRQKHDRQRVPPKK